MAYLQPQQDDDDEKQQSQQPSLSGGVGASPMTQGAQSGAQRQTSSAPSSPMQPQQSAMQGQGSGFVNLRSFLSPTVAGQNQQKVQSLGGQLQSQEKDSFNKAAEPVRNTSFTATTVADVNKSGGGVDVFGGVLNKAAGGDQDSMNNLRSWLTQDVTGPTKVDYTPGEASKRSGLLGNADTALNALNPGNYSDNLPSPMYGQGNQWLDQSLIKSDAGTMGEISKVNAGNSDMAKSFGDESAALAKKTAGFKADAEKARNDVRSELERQRGNTLGDVDRRVEQARAKDAEDARMIAAGYGKHTPDGPWQKVAAGEVRTDAVGSQATRENLVSDAESKRLGLLRGLLGSGDAIQKNGHHIAAQSGITQDPNYVAPPPQDGPVSGQYVDKFNAIVESTFKSDSSGGSGFNPDSNRLTDLMGQMDDAQWTHLVSQLQQRVGKRLSDKNTNEKSGKEWRTWNDYIVQLQKMRTWMQEKGFIPKNGGR